VGAGKVGEPKIGSLIDTGARIHVVAIEASDTVREWASAGKIQLDLRAFSEEDLDGKFLAVVATASNTLNELIYREAERRGVLCNVVDVPDYCDFFYPAVVRRGDLQIAISTAGKSPSLAQRLRQQLERQFGPGYADWLEQLGETRRLILASALDKERKLELLHSLASREAFEAVLAESQTASAKGEAA
jgi:precorrin-2 dehydrogenase/sirohydrochlorin ferrochelatase